MPRIRYRVAMSLDGYIAGLEARPSFLGAGREMVKINFDQVVG